MPTTPPPPPKQHILFVCDNEHKLKFLFLQIEHKAPQENKEWKDSMHQLSSFFVSGCVPFSPQKRWRTLRKLICIGANSLLSHSTFSRVSLCVSPVWKWMGREWIMIKVFWLWIKIFENYWIILIVYYVHFVT